jgi:hypothetical protein
MIQKLGDLDHLNLILIDKDLYEILEYEKELKSNKKANQYED